MNVDNSMAGRAVVVTGAGRGLGRAYALDAAAAGAAVVVNDVDAAETEAVVAQIRAARGRAVPAVADVSDPRQAASLVDTCVTTFGRLDGLVNNAGLYHESPPWEETPERMHRAVSVNVLGAMYCLSAAARTMRARGGGSIVNASSGGLFGFPTVSTYAATKGALLSLTWSAALDLAECGIRVNAVSPKAITRMTATALGRRLVPPGAGAAPLDGIADRTPERIAPLVTYLLSPLAEGITGQLFRFDGERICVVGSVAFDDHPGETRPGWDVAAVADAFDGPLGDHLQAFGVERRLPPRRAGAAPGTFVSTSVDAPDPSG
jgi:NAD(P)-dependent dehydrogenase (short-subunit alcohol dehydrogenase family)